MTSPRLKLTTISLLLLALPALAAPGAAQEVPGCAPTGLTALYQDGYVYLQWDPTAGATAYDVYRDPGDGELVYFTTVFAPDTYLYDHSVLGGRTYRYLVTAYVDGIESQSCGPVAVQTEGTPPPSCAPEPPLWTTGGPDGILVEWTATTGATQYNVYRWTDVDPQAFIGSTQAPSTSFFDAQTVPDVQYWYAITAVLDGVETQPCGYVGGRMAEAPPTPDPTVCAPADFTATALGSVVELTWTATANASHYNIYRAREDGEFRLVILADGSTTSTIDTQVEPLTTYHYYATAEGGGVVTPTCGAVTVTTNGPCAPMLTVTRGTNANSLEWTFLPAAQQYNVYRGKNAHQMELLAVVVNDNRYLDAAPDSKHKNLYQVRAVVDGEERPACNTA